MPLLVGPLHLC